MHAAKLLHTLLDNACGLIDKRLKKILFLAADTLTRHKQLSIVSLGRSLNRPSKVKHNIKCIDRLFGNRSLHSQRKNVYQSMVNLVLKNNPRPGIIVDWSGLTKGGAYHFLRASVIVNGRAITLYEQVYPLKEYIKEKTHREFLNTLKDLLPSECKPIIITDAGFRNTWFKLILTLGWDFVGRIRNNTHFFEEGQWKSIKTLYQKATN